MIDDRVKLVSQSFVDAQSRLADLVASIPADDRALVAGRAASVIAEMDSFVAWAWYYVQPKPFDPSIAVEDMVDDCSDVPE